MKITSIKIEKLFEIFDYDISFSNNENLLIITGPNGFGKTMILNIIFSLFNKDFLFFEKLVFEKITICLDGNILIFIFKELEKEQSVVKFVFGKNGIEVGKFDSTEFNKNKITSYQVNRPLGKASKFLDRYTRKKFSSDELIFETFNELPQEISNQLLKHKSIEISKIIDSIKVNIIKEQRLFKQAMFSFSDQQDNPIMIETIQAYAINLTQLISQNTIEFFKIAQDLDSSYPTRLISENGKITESEYYTRFNKLKEKQDKLYRNGLYENKQDAIAYSELDSKALLVYLKDLETKLGVFDKLLEKLELFTTILNERRFTYKIIQIDKDKGFYFKNSKGKELALIDLSSGEQHEVVLLYELIFNAKENTLVLIDEPEISLHVTWQKEFLKDIIKIISLQNIQVLIATHSPSIINDRWDLVYNCASDMLPHSNKQQIELGL